MSIENFSYLWSDDNYEWVLVKSKVGYSIENRANSSVLIIEDEICANEVINKMLQKGVPVYQSTEDLLNKCPPINIVGQPTLPEDFPVKRYKIFIAWSKELPLINQVKEFKKIFLKNEVKSDQELLAIAKNNEKWQFDTRYLDETKKKEMEDIAEKHGLKVVFEIDELRGLYNL